MQEDFDQAQSLVRLECKHIIYEILELIRDWSLIFRHFSLVHSPEVEMLVVAHGSEVGVTDFGFVEGHGAEDEVEEGDAKGKQVCHERLVSQIFGHFGRHVAPSATRLVRPAKASILVASQRASVPKVDDLEIEVRVEHQVCWFQISVAHLRLVHRPHRPDQLQTVESRHWQRQRSAPHQVPQYVAIRHVLVCDARYLDILVINLLVGHDDVFSRDRRCIVHSARVIYLVVHTASQFLLILASIENFQSYHSVTFLCFPNLSGRS